MTPNTAWLLLILAGFCEVIFTTCMKLSQNFTKWGWSLGFGAFMLLSLWLLNKASQVLPLGTSYAVWTGIGAAGTVVVGILLFGEPVNLTRVFFLLLLIGAVIGLKFLG